MGCLKIKFYRYKIILAFRKQKVLYIAQGILSSTNMEGTEANEATSFSKSREHMCIREGDGRGTRQHQSLFDILPKYQMHKNPKTPGASKNDLAGLYIKTESN